MDNVFAAIVGFPTNDSIGFRTTTTGS